MVGAGIFSLLGTTAEVAGSAVWLSFALAGGIAALQGYSFAKLGARYPTAGGLLEYVNKGYGVGHVATIVAWLTYAANIIVTAMVAVSFGSRAPKDIVPSGRFAEPATIARPSTRRAFAKREPRIENWATTSSPATTRRTPPPSRSPPCPSPRT